MCRFVPARRCSNPAWCKPSGPCLPARPLPGFQAGPLAFFGPVVGEVSALFEAQPGAQGDAGLRFGLFPPSLVRPRPLALALGFKPLELFFGNDMKTFQLVLAIVSLFLCALALAVEGNGFISRVDTATTESKEQPFADIEKIILDINIMHVALGGDAVVPKKTATSPPKVSPKICAECPEMVRIPSGKFMMGSDDSGSTTNTNEKPRHQVSVKTFSLGKYEVTQAQWLRVMGANPSFFKQCGDNCPVENVRYKEILVFIDKLNKKTGQRYRLPTEAEWEYACRSGGKNQTYCGGEDLGALAWYGEDMLAGSTHPVGKKAPNDLGLYDMSGNVGEWTCSAYTDIYDGSENLCARSAERRVERGGSWSSYDRIERSTTRADGKPYLTSISGGFRLAQD